MNGISRRQVLKGLVGAGAGSLATATGTTERPTRRRKNHRLVYERDADGTLHGYWHLEDGTVHGPIGPIREDTNE